MIFLKESKKYKKNGGQAMLISLIFFLFISIAVISGLVSPSVREFKIANDLLKSHQSLFLSESAIEDSYFRLKTGKALGGTNTITIDGNSASALISDSGYNQKTVSSLGDVDSRQRKNELVLNTGTGVSFSYGVQTGTGGFTMANGSSVQGSVYSNGNITGSGSITGTALSANSPALIADQVNGYGTIARDDFTLTTLDPAWIFTDPRGNTTYSLTNTPGHFEMSIPSGGLDHDCWTGQADCPRLLRTAPAGDFIVETKIDGLNISSVYQTYGILLWQDSNNFVRFEYWSDDNPKIAVWKIINGQGSNMILGPNLTLSNNNYIRVTKTGTSYKLEYSQNGSSWITGGTVSISNFTPTQLGILTINDTYNPATVGKFDYMEVAGNEIPSNNIIFGNANSTQDFAQSFQTSTTGAVNKVELYLKKVSTPSNLTVRIVADSNGAPGTNTLASGTLSASLISTTYNWVSVPFSSNPELTAGTTYWVVIDGSTNASRYYVIGANSNKYTNGTGKIGQYASTWNNTTPSGLGGFFKLYLGGLTGLISGITVGTGGIGNAYAHTVNNSNIAGINYCQTGSGNNKSCNTSLSDPTQVAMPISDQNILDWKTEAETGGTYSGNFTAGASSSLGPRKITGDLNVSNGANLTVTGTLWVEGNINISNNATVSLAPSYGSSEGVIVADGIVNISNNATFNGSGSAGSYLMVLSTSTSTSAITLSNNGGAVILYAANGTVNLANNASAKSLNGKSINLSNNSTVIYDSGLANVNFVNGPSGGWSITSWKEVK